MQRSGRNEKLTQSLSFWAVGTPISSNVFGPLPGRPPAEGLEGCVVGFWLAALAGVPEGLGVDVPDDWGNDAAEGEACGRGDPIELAWE